MAAILLTATPAATEPRCSERQFSATGAPGRVLFTAHRNARKLWSAKVRAELGKAYATWGRAASRDYECTFSQWRYRCSATARPCRSFASGK
jgi:hypothetical protein